MRETRPPKRVALLQSNYVPWKGYFDLIDSVDEFILYDEVQYTKNDWRNRNRIKAAGGGTRWLTLPVAGQGGLSKRIDQAVIAQEDWARRHWDILEQTYRGAACFDDVANDVRALLDEAGRSVHLSTVNALLIRGVCKMLGVATAITSSSDYASDPGKSARVASIVAAAGAEVYVSGPAAKAYLEQEEFDRRGVTVEWFDYPDYPSYPQPHGDFEHAVSILDVLFCTGARASDHVRRSTPRELT